MQKVTQALGRQSQTKRIETIISVNLLETIALLCSIIITTQLYTRDSSATLLLPLDQHHISDVVIRRL